MKEKYDSKSLSEKYESKSSINKEKCVDESSKEENISVKEKSKKSVLESSIFDYFKNIDDLEKKKLSFQATFNEQDKNMKESSVDDEKNI